MVVMVGNGNGNDIGRVVSGLLTMGVEAYLDKTILFDCTEFLPV